MAILPDELLRSIVGILEKLELRYFVTGSGPWMVQDESKDVARHPRKEILA